MTTDDNSYTSDPEKVPHERHDFESVSASSGDKDGASSSADRTQFAKAMSSGPVSGEIDMRIARDGSWYYLGSVINRKPLVKLFSSVLHREADGEYYLITPVEKARIKVDDAPFTAVEMTVAGTGRDQQLTFRTNVDDLVTVGADHPLRVQVDDENGQPSPYILVRDNLEALVARSVFYDLVALAVGPDGEAADETVGVWSGGKWFELGRTEDD